MRAFSLFAALVFAACTGAGYMVLFFRFIVLGGEDYTPPGLLVLAQFLTVPCILLAIFCAFHSLPRRGA